MCVDCRNRCRSAVNQLQSAQAKTTEEIAMISDAITNLQHEVQEVRQKCSSWPTLSSQSDDKPDQVPSVAIEVHRALSDMSRRKSNVVITGIPECNEDGSSDDEASFLNLCEECFSFKPSLSRLGCRRLGKQTSDRPRKLLVHLATEQNAKKCQKRHRNYASHPRLPTSILIQI